MSDSSYVKYVMDDYAALYRDGKLVADGEEYHITEYLESQLGVESYYDDNAFINPEKDRAFSTLEEVANNEDMVAKYEEEQEKLRERKKKLEKELSEVERHIR